MQNFLHYLSCNFDSEYYLYKYDNISKRMSTNNRLWPLTDFIYFDKFYLGNNNFNIFCFFIFFYISTLQM